jgi:hypothetical protein
VTAPSCSFCHLGPIVRSHPSSRIRFWRPRWLKTVPLPDESLEVADEHNKEICQFRAGVDVTLSISQVRSDRKIRWCHWLTSATSWSAICSPGPN